MRELANRVGVSPQAISKYEGGLDIPSSGVLLRLAEALGVKVEYFFRTRRVNLSVPAYRKNSALRRKQEQTVLAQIQGWLERYLEIEALFPPGDAVRGFVLPEGVNPRITVLEEAERVAEELRAAWQLGLASIENLTELLEDKGIKVGLVDGVDGFDACTFMMEDNTPVIVMRRSLAGDRQRFNLAHELGHIILRPEKGASAEKAAHRFAGAFLVPALAARRELGEQRQALSLYELHHFGSARHEFVPRISPPWLGPERTRRCSAPRGTKADGTARDACACGGSDLRIPCRRTVRQIPG
ncbi:helix-turn-helix domain-containing protein [Neomoorella mulderi]|uniref:helix-turn-helix domain-containing protein n=1 Tax=Neomoorella mulderi TaxID=202604 RepID=UPI00191C421F